MTESPTCDLDIHGGLVMPCNVLCLHCNLINARFFIAVLDGLISHCQILVNGTNTITQVHLVLGATAVTLLGRNKVLKLGQTGLWRIKMKTFLLPDPDEQ